MISLSSQSSVADLESFIRDVRQHPGQDLRLPTQVSRGGMFGFPAVAVQAIATWARMHGGVKRLQVTPSFATEASTQDRLGGSLWGMCGLYFADQVKSGDEILPRATALRAVTPRVLAMRDYKYRETLRGRGAALCCFEGARFEFLPALYSQQRRGTGNTTTIRSNAQFCDVLQELLEAASSGAAEMLGESRREVLGSLVFQLFKNADVHTITDVDGSFYRSGVRGVQVREIRLSTQADFDEFVADDHALNGYVSKLGHREVVRNKQAHGGRSTRLEWKPLRFIEITVFDTGPGLALRWLSAKHGAVSYSDVNRDQELDAVINCFELHATTEGSGLRGDGLAIALEAMKSLRAFLYLRTGRLALYQDFTSQDHSSFDPRPRYGQRRPLGAVAGATYSICFPLQQ